MIGYLILVPKLLLFLAHLIFGLSLACLLILALGPRWYMKPLGGVVKTGWLRILAFILNLKITRSGTSLDSAVVFVSNHISWLDVIALGCERNCVFVAKNSVQHWPLIGITAKLSGTLFINRKDKKDVVKTLARADKILENNISLAFFPEATTTSGKIIKPFRTSLYQTAIHSGSNVQAIGIRYQSILGKESPAPYIGDETFAAHLLKVLKTPRIEVDLSYCEPVVVNNNHDRKQLAETTQTQVAEILMLPNTGL